MGGPESLHQRPHFPQTDPARFPPEDRIPPVVQLNEIGLVAVADIHFYAKFRVIRQVQRPDQRFRQYVGGAFQGLFFKHHLFVMGAKRPLAPQPEILRHGSPVRHPLRSVSAASRVLPGFPLQMDLQYVR